jgi:citronellol/citronellal dehydrogenase
LNPSVLHPNLSGRVAVVTGASRGIGKALALRLAQEGADVVIAAKSETSSEKLPGTIYETAKSVEAMGRRALAMPTDVRDESQVERLIQRTIEQFGRIDILINNAGALWWQPVVDTPPKRFDLMMQVNVRAAYLGTYYALPHMKKQQWGHILGFTPPMHTNPNPGKVCYMISKHAIAMLAIGVAEEHRADNIASNVLWPRTIIESQASINWGMLDKSQWRTPEIVCDAAMTIFGQEPRAFTGRQVIDEQVLTELAGVQNFDHYWCLGKPPANPMFIDAW